MPNRSSASVAISFLTSVLTSAIVTAGILYFTGNLRFPNSPSVPEKIESPAPEAKTVETPSLKGLTTDIAADVLNARGLRLVVQEERGDATVPKGQICLQDPLSGSILNTGGAVAVIVSTGPDLTPVPDVTDKSLEEAKRLLTEAGFKIGEITQSDTGTPGMVVATSPEKGTPVAPDTTVGITVTGALTVPKVVGMYLSRGKKTLTDAGLKVGKIKWGYSDYLDSSAIISQEPKADEIAAPGTEVILTVNSD